LIKDGDIVCTERGRECKPTISRFIQCLHFCMGLRVLENNEHGWATKTLNADVRLSAHAEEEEEREA
jgi:hypothetical protein